MCIACVIIAGRRWRSGREGRFGFSEIELREVGACDLALFQGIGRVPCETWPTLVHAPRRRFFLGCELGVPP